MIFQLEDFNFSSDLTPVIEVFLLIFLLCLQVYFLKKKNVFILVVVVLLFSLIIGVISIVNYSLPFTPWIQLFFILFQVAIVLNKAF